MVFNLKIIMLLISAYLIRPTAFGQQYTTIGIAVSVVALVLHLVDVKRRGDKIIIPPQNAAVMFLVTMLFTLLSLHTQIVGSFTNPDFVLKALIAHIVVIISFGIVLSENKSKYRFFRSFAQTLLFFISSYYITLLLSIFIPFESLKIYSLPVAGYEGSTGDTYFPFTVLYTFFGTGQGEQLLLPRLLGLFRESGILQMFIICVLFNLKAINLDRWWVKTLLFLGIIASFSTAGVAIFFGTLLLKFVLDKKFVTALIILVITYLAVMYTPYIGIEAKSDTHGASLSDRSFAIERTIAQLEEAPFGTGLYNSTVKNSGINLLAVSATIGIQGFLLVIITYFVPMIYTDNRKQYILATAPIILTSLTSQPILDAPLVYIMFMAPTTLIYPVTRMVKVKKQKRINQLDPINNLPRNTQELIERKRNNSPNLNI